MKKRDYLIAAAIPVLTGIFATLLTGEGMQAFETINKPPLSPPGWLFPIVWTILYLAMGTASYLIAVSGADSMKIDEAFLYYGLQLLVNFLWPIVFFGFQKYFAAVLVLILLMVLILKTISLFRGISKTAAGLMIPYLLWVTFAGYLTVGIWLLN